jgi:hypothetical protein
MNVRKMGVVSDTAEAMELGGHGGPMGVSESLFIAVAFELEGSSVVVGQGLLDVSDSSCEGCVGEPRSANSQAC